MISQLSQIRRRRTVLQDPNPDDPLNKEAAEALVSDRYTFERQVQAAISRGTSIGRDYFPACRA